MLAVGFIDSIVKVWSLVPQKLKTMKSADQLQDINIEAEDVLVCTLVLVLALIHSAYIWFRKKEKEYIPY